MRWAVFAPTPFTDLKSATLLPAIALEKSSTFIDDMIMRAILGPTPDTEISRRKASRSFLVLKP